MAQENVILVGHRGAMGYEPENTLLSFKKAIELGADMIELDVYVCKSGELVVIHDTSVNRTTNDSGFVKNKTLEWLKKLDAGKGEKIPTLEEVLNLVDKRVAVDIELKGKNTAKPVSEIISRYVKEKGWKYVDFYVSSFNHAELGRFKKLVPEVKIGLLTKKIKENFLAVAKRAKAYSVNVPIGKVDREFVEAAHERGLKVFVWTVDTPSEIEKAKILNADYICSGFPDRI